jgi:two-component system, OmpR family, sensor histidine kinase KdpD
MTTTHGPHADPRLVPGRPAEYVLAGGLVLVLALVLVIERGHLTRTSDVLAFLLAVIGAALAGCAARRARQAAAAIAEAEAARPIAEADRARTALLGAVSHDLRTPLAAAKAAVSCLRSSELALTAEDHDDLLATADESLNLLAHLAAGLLDMTRLQAGAVPVFPRPADLGEIVARSLAGLRPRAGAVMVSIPPGLPQVMADPAIMERVIANLTANGLRYAPDGSSVLLTASARGDRVELCVVDHGPGVPEADRDRMFVPFQRLQDTSSGVGLGLTVSRGLTEAMGGSLEPGGTPGGGLTMTVSVPAAPGLARQSRPAASLTQSGREEAA